MHEESWLLTKAERVKLDLQARIRDLQAEATEREHIIKACDRQFAAMRTRAENAEAEVAAVRRVLTAEASKYQHEAEAAEAEVARLKERLDPHRDPETGQWLDAIDLAEFRESMARIDANKAEAKVKAAEGLPRYVVRSTPDRPIPRLEQCSDGTLILVTDLEAALK